MNERTRPKDPIAVGSATGGSRRGRAVAVRHVIETFSYSYERFDENLKGLLGRFDAAAVELAGTGVEEALRRQKAAQGEQELMIFASNEHGALFPLAGLARRKAIRYYVGNPIIALKMTQKNIGAALYASLSLLLYEKNEREVCVEYDFPSSSFLKFVGPEIDGVAATLDLKVHTLLAKASL